MTGPRLTVQRRKYWQDRDGWQVMDGNMIVAEFYSTAGFTVDLEAEALAYAIKLEGTP